MDQSSETEQLVEHVHAIMMARVEDVGYDFYRPSPRALPQPDGNSDDLNEEEK